MSYEVRLLVLGLQFVFMSLSLSFAKHRSDTHRISVVEFCCHSVTALPAMAADVIIYM